LTENDATIARRKLEHLRIVAEENVVHSGSTLLNDIHLLHRALPELDLEEIDSSTEFFGKRLRAPLMITSMTGGAQIAREMNRALAQVASQHGIAFAVGSQRVIFRHPEMEADFAVRNWIPNGVLLGNIGAGELLEYPPERIRELMNSIEADGMCVHLNAAQELVQAEGHRNFRGLLNAIARLVDTLKGKVLVKETGAGLDPHTFRKLSEIGVPYIDISGAGGTSWTKVEMYRSTEAILQETGKVFADWGIPTAFCIVAARRIFGNKGCIIASGGITSGLDAARAIAAGADIAGFARPALLAYLNGGIEKASEFVEAIIHSLKTAMILTGALDIKSLQAVPRVYTGELREWLLSFGWLGEKEL